MGTLSFLIAEIEEGGGFGLNFDLLDTNLINLVIIIGVLVVFGRKSLGGSLSDRKTQIQDSIKEAETRKKNASADLAGQQQKLAQAKAEAEKLVKDAHERAEKAKVSILAQADKDIERLQAEAQRDMSSQQERILLELRQRVADLSLERVESRLKAELDDSAQQNLLESSVAMLGG
ncbi:MAG: F0F1 ATP synthase subunit B [Elainellaceae cyanobacterium]